MPIPGLELVAGAAVGYLVRKVRRVGSRADGEVDRVLDEGMDALHDLVSGVVGDDPAVNRLLEQAGDGEVTERTTRRATDAIADTAEEHPHFADELAGLVDRLQRHEAGLVQHGDGGVAAGRDVRAETGGVIVGGDVSGGVTTGPHPPQPEPREG
ncbi:hypothetical protein ACIQU5_31285 [Streptomyces sp. NPDC090306]|uniref:hypothetical protein n=1 Tax=Streptomyces sp. NPDC090306 TaxID=3365961 RepID=UPI0037F78D57